MMTYATARDRIAFRSSLRPLKSAAFSVIDALQTQPRDIQIEAAGIAFVALSLAIGEDPHALVVRAKRQLADAESVRNGDLEAISDYAKGELL